MVPTGRKLVGYSTKDLNIHFLKGEIENPAITAMAYTSVKGSQVIALAEKQTTDAAGKVHEPRVVIHNPNKERKKVLSHKHLTCEKEIEIIQIVFSSNPPKVISLLGSTNSFA